MPKRILSLLRRGRLLFFVLLYTYAQQTSCSQVLLRDLLRARMVDPDEPIKAGEMRFHGASALMMPPVRSLFYFRLSRGTEWERLIGSVLERLLPGAPTLEIEHCDFIGGGLRLPHGHATVIWAQSIGQDCLIRQQVTIGARDLADRWAYPTLGDRVTIGAGAIVLGGVHIGDGATVGAGAVVLQDVPPGCIVVGVPARCVNPAGRS